jgi:FkbM family methyltransferase
MSRLKRLFYRLRDAWHADLRRELQSQTDRLVAIRKMDMLGPERTITFDYFGESVRFYLPHADLDVLQTHILVNETFRDEPILRFVRQHYLTGGGRVADVGANIGNHTVFFGLICRADSVVAIEPSPQVGPILRRNVVLNGLGNVELRDEGAGSGDATATVLDSDPRNTGGTRIGAGPNGTIRVRPLDDSVGRCDFLKIDVEGMAVDVLNGAAGMLSECRPPVLIELHRHEYRGGEELLRRHGYRLSKVFRQGEAAIDFLFERK